MKITLPSIGSKWETITGHVISLKDLNKDRYFIGFGHDPEILRDSLNKEWYTLVSNMFSIKRISK